MDSARWSQSALMACWPSEGTPPAWARAAETAATPAIARTDPAVTSEPRWRETRPPTPAGSGGTSPPSRRRSRSGLWNDIVAGRRTLLARARGGVRARVFDESGRLRTKRLRAELRVGCMGIQSGRRPRWLSPHPARKIAHHAPRANFRVGTSRVARRATAIRGAFLRPRPATRGTRRRARRACDARRVVGAHARARGSNLRRSPPLRALALPPRLDDVRRARARVARAAVRPAPPRR